MGVPTLTILGRSHQARMGASIMGAAGLPEFVAEDEQEWVGHGVKLIRSRDKLSVLRSTLRYRLQHSPLLDSAGLAAELEEIYQKIA